MIAKMISATIRHYGDSRQTKAIVEWVNTRGQSGSTEGNPANLHMQALLTRAAREGHPVLFDLCEAPPWMRPAELSDRYV